MDFFRIKRISIISCHMFSLSIQEQTLFLSVAPAPTKAEVLLPCSSAFSLSRCSDRKKKVKTKVSRLCEYAL